jgi:HSP20 family protein
MINKEANAVQNAKIRPYYETSEGRDAYEVRVYMPGVGKDGISISHRGDDLSISGTRKNLIPKSWRTLCRESRDCDYELRLTLNVQIDDSKIAAKTENGVLRLTLPKAEEVKPKLIAIE